MASSDMTVAILGASGFVGATLTERLMHAGIRVRAFVNTFGSAWRLASRGIPMQRLDIMRRSTIPEALAGCSHVVNCTRGGDAVMLEGFRHLLDGARSAKVRRFVHLSSVAVYGDPPPSTATSEDAPAIPPKGSYGWMKLQQDIRAEQAHARGLDCITLCPPNIGGRYSSFYAGLIDDLRRNRFVMLGNGTAPINVVDVDNLCHAIELALTAAPNDGRRIFITDGPHVCWRDLVDALLPLAGRGESVPSLPPDDAFWHVRPAKTARPNPLHSLRHLVSSDVRQALRQDRLLASIDTTMRSLVASVPAIEARLRDRIGGPIPVERVGLGPRYDSNYSRQQLRMVEHGLARAERLLGYQPELRFTASIEQYNQWYRETYALDEPHAPLVSEMRDMLAQHAG